MNTSGKIEEAWNTHPEWTRVIQLDQKFFPRPWTPEQWSELDPALHLLFIFQKGSEITGFCLFHLVPGDETAHLLKILIIPELRGSETLSYWKGVKQNLKSRQVKSVFLEVEEGNSRAIGFYEKCGFQVLRKVKNFYSDGASARTMQLTL